MCAINGVVTKEGKEFNSTKVLEMFSKAVERGRDSFGVGWYINEKPLNLKIASAYKPLSPNVFGNSEILISNHRAEPTTEYKKEKSLEDIHPFIHGNFMLVHNGIIANDKELAKKFGREDLIGKIDSAVLAEIISDCCLTEEGAIDFIIQHVKGSYAIALSFGKKVALIANYKPIYINDQPEGIYFSSLPRYIEFDGKFSFKDNIKKLPPYSAVFIDKHGISDYITFKHEPKNKALVVCSGGLDSTVALTVAVNRFGKENVSLLNFLYGCNAQSKEEEAVKNIAEYFGVGLIKMQINIFKDVITESPILRKDGEIQSYDKGVEFAYEWVPARNLVMMALATAYAEAKGFGWIYLGNNLEESGAYPDNEMEFMDKFRELLPNAVRDGYSIDVVQPVGNLMKHEIVSFGLALKAPLHLTWSCYKGGKLHCGICAPCRMRKVGFQMVGKEEVVRYEQ